MKSNSRSKNQLSVKLISSLTFMLMITFKSNLTYAQALEEIIVTSQKRAESLQDVSVSVTALSGEKLADGAIARLEEVTAFVPNFTLSETGIGTNIYIRGIGSGINQGFEQSVGMYFDGIYYGRAQLARSPIFDLERLEVLKGPQVTLFGNNSIGGAVSINSAKPTDYFEGSTMLMYSPGHGEKEINLVLSGPINDNLNSRLAIRKYGMDGYMFNAARNRNEPNRDYLTTRLSFQFIPDNDVFEANLKLEHSDFDVKGRQIAIIRDEPTNYVGTNEQVSFARNPNLVRAGSVIGNSGSPNFQPIYADFPTPNLTEMFNTSLFRPALADQNVDAVVFNNVTEDVAYPNQLEKRGSNNDYSRNTINNITANISIPTSTGDLQLISGYLGYEYQDLCDCDFTAAQLLEYQSEEEYRQVSQEIRFTSASNDYFDYIVGVYYQKDQLDFKDFVIVEGDSELEQFLRLMLSTTQQDAGNLVNISAPRTFEVDSELIAGFAQGTVYITPSTRLMLGVRESQVVKSGARELSLKKSDLISPLDDDQYSDVEFVFNAGLKVSAHNSSGRRQENRTSWSAIIEQDLSDDYMMYFSAVNGFKGGGFDARSNKPANPMDLTNASGGQGTRPILWIPGTFEFEDEEALAYELGLKARIADRAEVNISYFYTDIKGLQLSVFDGGVGFNVSNAGHAISQGVEIEGRISLTEHWFMNASLAWLEFEYKDYKDGLCRSSDLLIMADINQITESNNCSVQFRSYEFLEDPLKVKTADFAGETNQYVASYSGALSLQYENNINDKYLFKGSVDMNFTDNYNPAQNLDPALEQDSYAVFNLRLALLDDINEKWEVALIGRNITDEKIISYANDVPLSTSLFGTQTSYGFVQRTKSWALQTKYNF